MNRHSFREAAVRLSVLAACCAAWSAQAAPAAVPTHLRVPILAADDQSLELVWDRPADASGIVDYKVYMDGKLLGSAVDNARRFSAAQPYVDAFYAADKQGFHVKTVQHNFRVAGLKADTRYRFSVRAVMRNGSLSAPSAVLVARTTPTPALCDVTAHGAKGDGRTLDTQAIQATIDACPAGGKVLVPAGVFKTGALFLKSDMTLEVTEGATLLGSERQQDYPMLRGYTLYAYSKVNRPPSLINALDPIRRAAGTFRNIRIVGKGVIDGNGFKRQGAGEIRDESGRMLPQFVKSNRDKVDGDGILAAAQMAQAMSEGQSRHTAYGQRRSSLITLRGVKNLYIGDVTVQNPAFHGIMILEGENATVDSVRFQTYDVNNGDGIEFGNSKHALVFNSFFDTGDDCLNFAAGTGEEATKQPPQSDTWIFDNYFRLGHGAVVMGSHTGAWIEKILAEDNVINGTDIALRGKSNSLNGGGGRNVVFRDNAILNPLKESFIFTLQYEDSNALLDYQPAKQQAYFHDILVRHNSVEFNAQMPQDDNHANGSPAMKHYPVIHVQGDMKSHAYHQRIRFEDLTIKGGYPAMIDGLKDSLFRNVRFRDMQEGKAWGLVKNAPGTRFEGSTPKPEVH